MPDSTIAIQSVPDATWRYVRQHAVGTAGFASTPGASEPELYATIDAIYSLHISGALGRVTDAPQRAAWRDFLLDCQDDDGWFSRRKPRDYAVEHASAYAVGALTLLASRTRAWDGLRPIRALRPLLTDPRLLVPWISAMGFSWSWQGLRQKRYGWHQVWRGSHVGGGVAALIGMLPDALASWWPDATGTDAWFSRYFEWLDRAADPATGLWRRALWNRVVPSPTRYDLGGAAHFFWIYAARRHPLPYPRAALEATLALQRASGLYDAQPYCLDFDASHALGLAFAQLGPDERAALTPRLHDALQRNVQAILAAIMAPGGELCLRKMHDLPGCLAAIARGIRIRGGAEAEAIGTWREPLDRAWWL